MSFQQLNFSFIFTLRFLLDKQHFPCHLHHQLPHNIPKSLATTTPIQSSSLVSPPNTVKPPLHPSPQQPQPLNPSPPSHPSSFPDDHYSKTKENVKNLAAPPSEKDAKKSEKKKSEKICPH